MGYVYVKTSAQDRLQNMYKIGKWSKDFHSLYKRYGTSTPNLEIVLCMWFDKEWEIEKAVHNDLLQYKIEGQGVEHFQCSLKKIVDTIMKYGQRSGDIISSQLENPNDKFVKQDLRMLDCLVNEPKSFYQLIKTEDMFIDLNTFDAICVTCNIDHPLFLARKSEPGWVDPREVYACKVSPYGVRPNTCYGYPATWFYNKQNLDQLIEGDLRKTIEYTSKNFGELRYEGYDQRCIALKKGTTNRCKVKATKGSQFCKYHK